MTPALTGLHVPHPCDRCPASPRRSGRQAADFARHHQEAATYSPAFSASMAALIDNRFRLIGHLVMVVTTMLMLSAFSRMVANLAEIDAVDLHQLLMAASMPPRCVRPVVASEAGLVDVSYTCPWCRPILAGGGDLANRGGHFVVEVLSPCDVPSCCRAVAAICEAWTTTGGSIRGRWAPWPAPWPIRPLMAFANAPNSSRNRRPLGRSGAGALGHLIDAGDEHVRRADDAARDQQRHDTKGIATPLEMT